MKWKSTPKVKIYEALGAVADGRVELHDNTAKVYSSTRNKYYDVTYTEGGTIMSNDNGSYWVGYLGYPGVAFLMRKGLVSYDAKVAGILQGVAWKDINQQFKNFDKALEHILSTKTEAEREALKTLVDKIGKEVENLALGYEGKRVLPPEGY